MSTPCGYQQVAAGGADTAIGLTVPTGLYQLPSYCIITPVTQAIRWRDDGTSPTTTVGMPQVVNVPFTYNGNLKAFKMIASTAGAEVNISYYY
jgi:hypothetical protein